VEIASADFDREVTKPLPCRDEGVALRACHRFPPALPLSLIVWEIQRRFAGGGTSGKSFPETIKHVLHTTVCGLWK
jgi:hypothetical protein